MKKYIIYSITFIMIFSILRVFEYNLSNSVSNNEDEVAIVEVEIQDIAYVDEEIIVESKLDIINRVIEKKEVKPIEIVFNENDLNEISNMTYKDMEMLLADTTMSHLADAIIDSEKEYQVNAFFTLSVIALESSWATSTRASNSNNLTGMAVYGDYSPGEQYSTQYECVLETVRQIKKHYLLSDGMYYNGCSTEGVNVKYSANNNWHNIVNQIAYEMMDKYNKITKGD